MSTVNYKKTDHEQIRNSLVVEAIKLIKEIHPKVFIFENVRAFLTSICTDVSGKDMLIKDSILLNLSDMYNIYWRVINFKDFGVPSSRPRTLVIGTSKTLEDISPLNMFPTRRKEITLREAIGSFPHLEFGEKDAQDPLHFARPFPKHEISWIADLKEGQSAFDKPIEQQPYKIDKDGKRVVLKGAYIGNKYRRLFWDKPGACVATRNDVLSSQDTIHPCDNRVLSIRELMRIMTIPDSFKWTDEDDSLTVEHSSAYLSRHEMNIRRCIGEAVPTEIIRCISEKTQAMLDYSDSIKSGEKINNNYYSENHADIVSQSIVYDEIRKCDDSLQQVSLGVFSKAGFLSYVPQFASYYATAENVTITVTGINETDKRFLIDLMRKMDLGENVSVTLDSHDDCESCDYYIDSDLRLHKTVHQLSIFE